ncbi:acidic mammalian chitinase-like [Festucalex cinctus]
MTRQDATGLVAMTRQDPIRLDLLWSGYDEDQLGCCHFESLSPVSITFAFKIVWEIFKCNPVKSKDDLLFYLTSIPKSNKMYALILLAGLCALNAQLGTPKKLVCTFQKDSSPNPFDIVEDIDPYLCTHLIYSSLKPEPVEVTASPSDLNNFPQFNSHKITNPNLKTLLEVDLTDLTTNDIFAPNNRAIFIQSVIDVMIPEQFDGVNIVWVIKQGVNQLNDKQRFTLLMQELKAEMQVALGVRMLTASVSAENIYIDYSYEVPLLAGIVNFFNVITFDLDRTPPPGTNPAPFPNAQTAMYYWVSKGAPKRKLNMGTAAYGFDTSPTANLLIWPIYTVCSATTSSPVHVDSDATIQAKANYIIAEHFGGAFVKSVDLDDFNAACGQGHYLVIRQIHNILI